jgi:hypothetical protein
METITISKTEYADLKRQAKVLRQLVTTMPNDVFLPPVRSRKQVLKEFKKTGKYTAQFLKHLSKGLKRSNYFTV